MPVLEKLITKHGASKNVAGILYHVERLTEKIKQFCLCKQTACNTGRAHTVAYSNIHQKSYFIHVQVIFQETTVLCSLTHLYISVF